MSRILLIGHSPPPFQPHSKVEAAHYRTWQFVQPLLDDGHAICLCVDHSNQPLSSGVMPANFVWHSVSFDTVGWTRHLQAIHNTFRPDCVVAVGFHPSLCATKLNTSKPIWMDIYGDPLTIVQVARYRAGSNRGIGTTVAAMRQVLRRGDVFSTCGMPQQHALVGELAMCGRLNVHTFGYSFVHVIYPGVAPISRENTAANREVLQSHGISLDAFVVLWCGGYNTWTDVLTLYRALEWAMDRDPRVHFVSLGASTYQAEETMYDRFVVLIAQSRHAPRFHMLGWRPWGEIPDFYRAADVGISIDALHYETIYGTRTRLVEMLAYGLPIITSEGCELSYIIRDKGAGLSFSAGDWHSLAQHILKLATNSAKLEHLRQAAYALASRDLSFRTTTNPLLSWARAPDPAPDNEVREFSARIKATEYKMRTMVRMFLWRWFGLSK